MLARTRSMARRTGVWMPRLFFLLYSIKIAAKVSLRICIWLTANGKNGKSRKRSDGHKFYAHIPARSCLSIFLSLRRFAWANRIFMYLRRTQWASQKAMLDWLRVSIIHMNLADIYICWVIRLMANSIEEMAAVDDERCLYFCSPLPRIQRFIASHCSVLQVP